MVRGGYAATTDTLSQSYLWMFVGLTLSGGVAYFVASHQSFSSSLYSNGLLFYGLIILELLLVFFLSLRISVMSYSTALVTFLAYSLLNGVTISSIFQLYTTTSIAVVFFVSALMFGAAALYGHTTKHSLGRIGSLGFVALIGIIIGWLVNYLLKSPSLDYWLSFLAVIVFVGLTAYDTQKIEQLEYTSDSQNLGIIGALTIYLDFINIFLNLLRIFGRQRNE